MPNIFEQAQINYPLREIKIGTHKAHVEVVSNPEDCSQGLMGRKYLLPDHGMLFDFGKDQHLHFWMKDTSIPLSIAFIKEDGSITQIEDMKPFDLTVIKSKEKCRYALEMNQGWFGIRNINDATCDF